MQRRDDMPRVADRRLATSPAMRILGRFAAWTLIATGFWYVANHTLVPGRGWLEASPQAISGDEPHYLIEINSLLTDGDLDLGDQYRAARDGGWQAGGRFRGLQLDHHTVLFDPATGDAELWSRVFDWQRRSPCETPGCHGHARVSSRLPASTTLREAPAHPPGFPMLVAALLSPLALSPITLSGGQVEAGVVALQTGFAAAAVVLTFELAIAAGFGPWGGLAAVLLLLLSPWTAYARSVFSEPLAGLLVVAGALAHQRRKAALAALALGLAMWIKPPFVLFGAALLLSHLRAKRLRPAAHTALVMSVVGVALLVFNLRLAGIPLISGQLGWRWIARPQQLLATLTSSHHGLLLFAPWVAAGGAALALGVLRADTNAPPGLRDFGWALLPWLLLHMLHGSLGELCWGPRYWVPWLPVLAVATLLAWRGYGLRGRVAVVLAVAAGAFATWPAVLAWPFVWGRPAWVGLEILGG